MSYAQDNLKRAHESLDRLKSKDPKWKDIPRYEEEMAKYDKIMADFESAKRLDSRVAEAYLLKGQALARSGDTAAADEYRARAIALEPSLEDRR